MTIGPIRVLLADDHLVSSILGKLGVASRTEAVVLAVQHHTNAAS